MGINANDYEICLQNDEGGKDFIFFSAYINIHWNFTFIFWEDVYFYLFLLVDFKQHTMGFKWDEFLVIFNFI